MVERNKPRLWALAGCRARQRHRFDASGPAEEDKTQIGDCRVTRLENASKGRVTAHGPGQGGRDGLTACDETGIQWAGAEKGTAVNWSSATGLKLT